MGQASCPCRARQGDAVRKVQRENRTATKRASWKMNAFETNPTDRSSKPFSPALLFRNSTKAVSKSFWLTLLLRLASATLISDAKPVTLR
jgi:hypothetical protein